MQEWLINLSVHHSFWVYLFVIVTACAEGPLLSIIFGVLIKLGYFPLIPVYAAVMIGDLLGDCAWYFIGRMWGHSFIKKFGKYVSIHEEGVTKVLKIFQKHKNRILIISKITNGFGLSLVTLLTAGIARIPFYQYLGLNLIGQFVWSGILLSVGYFFSNAYMQIDSVLGKVFLVGTFVAIVALFVGFLKYLRKRSETMS